MLLIDKIVYMYSEFFSERYNLQTDKTNTLQNSSKKQCATTCQKSLRDF